MSVDPGERASPPMRNTDLLYSLASEVSVAVSEPRTRRWLRNIEGSGFGPPLMKSSEPLLGKEYVVPETTRFEPGRRIWSLIQRAGILKSVGRDVVLWASSRLENLVRVRRR